MKERGSDLLYCCRDCQASDYVFTLNMNKMIDGLIQKRHILYMDERLQLAISRLQPGERVDWETHEKEDQFIRVERGVLTVDLEGGITRQLIADALDVIIIPAGKRHQLSNQTGMVVSFYTIYSPPAHTKEEMAEDEALFRQSH
jgi:mannose-6-phosphate isomerase-like protein (cupin superfamily)